MTEQHHISDLSVIADHARHKEEETDSFYRFLLEHSEQEIDDKVHRLNAQVEAAIDCTTCGNCCRSLMINVTSDEVISLGEHLQLSYQEVKDRYIEESLQGHFIMNTIPCSFLVEKKCSVYEHRFTECRDFPHLHKPGFLARFPGTMLHYGSCPIIFNVIEWLKRELAFERR
ncbi:MAG: YkgJ family cysteine cluster protein [Chitinophagaceae bacterium]|nr:YkgJ family cysteine cluster protein [Chitinophagaceae bacterium]